MAVERPVARLVRRQQDRHFLARRHDHHMLQRPALGLAILQLDEHAVQVHRMRHHGLVHIADAHPLAIGHPDRLALLELPAVQRPDIAFHDAGQPDQDFLARLAVVAIPDEGLQIGIGQRLLAGQRAGLVPADRRPAIRRNGRSHGVAGMGAMPCGGRYGCRMVHSAMRHAGMRSMPWGTLIHRPVIHAHGAVIHVGHGQDGARPQRWYLRLHAGPGRQRGAGIARPVQRFGHDGEGAILLRADDHVIGLTDAETELVRLHRHHELSVGGDHRHRQVRDADIEEAHGGSVDETQPDPLARLEQAGPVVLRTAAIHQKSIAGDIRQIGRVHPHIAPFQPVFEGGVEALPIGLPEEVDQRALAVIVIAFLALQVAQHRPRILLRVVGQHDDIVAVIARRLAARRLDHNGAIHALLFLQSGMAVIPVGARLAQLEAVGIGLAGLDRLIAVEARRAIHDALDQQTVPVNRGWLGQAVGHLDDHLLALAPAQGRRRYRAADGDGVAFHAVHHDSLCLNGQLQLLVGRGKAAPPRIERHGAGQAGGASQLKRVPPADLRRNDAVHVCLLTSGPNRRGTAQPPPCRSRNGRECCRRIPACPRTGRSRSVHPTGPAPAARCSGRHAAWNGTCPSSNDPSSSSRGRWRWG